MYTCPKTSSWNVSTALKVMPIRGSAMTMKMNIISSGVLRTRVTYVAAARRITATGPTRIAASGSPKASDRIPAVTKSPMVMPKALITRSKLDRTSSTLALLPLLSV